MKTQIQETLVLSRIYENKFTLRHIPSETAQLSKSLKSNQRKECVYGTIHYKHSKFLSIATIVIK